MLKSSLTVLIRETARAFQKAEKELSNRKGPVTSEAFTGTFEEMFSNWQNKMYLACKEDNRHLAFMSMISMTAMLSEIGSEYDIGNYDVMSGYEPNDLKVTAETFNSVLNSYLDEYKKAGIEVKRYSNIDEFARDYVRNT